MSKFIPRGLGWWRDLPDSRDYTPHHERVIQMLSRLKRPSKRPRAVPSTVDLRRDDGGEYFPAIDDQGSLDSSSAFAVLSLVEYFERRSMGRTLDGSQLFLYKQALKLLHLNSDAGVNLRTTLKALIRFGVPPEEYWPCQAESFDADPQDPSLFSYFRDYAGIYYVRLDLRNTDGRTTLSRVKSFLAAGFPSVFGFPVPRSLSAEADIPYRPTLDSFRGGQAVVAVGYNDDRPSEGALLVRCSWGETWGESGYGWLPYAYVEEQLAVDFWVLLRDDWLESREYSQPIEPRP